jgi:hypothetical protein
LLVPLILLISTGVVYAMQFQRGINGSATIARISAPPDAIQLWESIGPEKTQLTEANFGPLDLDPAGNLLDPVRIPIWVENGLSEPFELVVEAANVKVSTVPGGVPDSPMDGAIRILFGPTGGKLLPAVEHAVIIAVGEDNIFAGELALEFLKLPEELGGAGTELDFDIEFKARTPDA